MRGGWVLLALAGIVGFGGLLLAASLPSRIDARSLACRADPGSNVGVLERSLGLGSCPVEGLEHGAPSR